MKSKYRIIQHPWVGFSGNTHMGYVVEKKYWIFGWLTYGCGKIFDSFQQAENYVNGVLLKDKTIVGEYS